MNNNNNNNNNAHHHHHDDDDNNNNNNNINNRRRWQVLIVPISHDVRSVADSPPNVVADVKAYKAALRAFYASTGRAAVFFERAIAITQSQSHAFVEALPVPQAKADELGPLFIELGGKAGIDFQVVADFDSAVEEMEMEEDGGGGGGGGAAGSSSRSSGGTQYFCVELPDETCLLHKFKRE